MHKASFERLHHLHPKPNANVSIYTVTWTGKWDKEEHCTYFLMPANHFDDLFFVVYNPLFHIRVSTACLYTFFYQRTAIIPSESKLWREVKRL